MSPRVQKVVFYAAIALLLIVAIVSLVVNR